MCTFLSYLWVWSLNFSKIPIMVIFFYIDWLTYISISFQCESCLTFPEKKKECMCFFSWWYVDFFLLSLKRALLNNICVTFGVDLPKTSPVRVKISLVVAQNGHWFVDFLWTSLVENCICGFWCWLAQNESNEGQNFTSVWRKRPLICWFPLNEPRWQIYVWLLVLTCSKRVQRGPKFH